MEHFRTFAALLTLVTARMAILSLFISAPAMAANLDLANDAAPGGPGKFAEEEIRREAVAHGINLKEDANAIRISITLGTDGNATAQRYSSRVKNESGRREIAVRFTPSSGALSLAPEIA